MTVSIKAVMSSELSGVRRAFGRDRGGRMREYDQLKVMNK